MIDMEASKRNRVEDQRILNINHNKLPSRNTPPLNSPIPVFINHNVVTRRHMVPQNFVLKSK